MAEMLSSQGEAAPRQRLAYGAVPLDPWKATYPDTDKPYLTVSSGHIKNVLDVAIVRATESGWVHDDDLRKKLHEFMSQSLQDSHMLRILRNGAVLNGDNELVHLPLDDIINPEDPAVEWAKQGTATPADLFGILDRYPDFGSIELAKLSHPLDFSATAGMDNSIVDILVSCGSRVELLDSLYRYKMKRLDSTLPAAIIVRKREIAHVVTENGFIGITERKTLLVRGDKEARGDDEFLCRRIKNNENFSTLNKALKSKIDYFFKDGDYLNDVNSKWIQPTATSYYAKYI